MQSKKSRSAGLKSSVLLLSLLALGSVTRAEIGNVNRDEDLGQIVGEHKVFEESTEWETQGGGEVSWSESSEAGQVDPNYVPILPDSEE